MELSKQQILEADDLQIEKVDTPEWGGHIYVRTLCADESYQYSKSNIDGDGKIKETNLIVEYCALVMCNSKGEQIFNSEDIEQLARKNTKTLLRVYEAGKKLNGEDIEDLEKNLEQTQNDFSDSD